MKTFNSMHSELNRSGNPCSYWGECGDWFVFLGRNRDSDILTECNFTEACKALDEIQTAVEKESLEHDSEIEVYTIERENHWACGWVEFILINPNVKAAISLAEELLAKLENYSVLSDDALSEAETEDAIECWEAYGRSDCDDAMRKVIGDNAFDELTEEQLNNAYDHARQHVNWEYQHDNSGCNFNTDGLVDKATEFLGFVAE